MVARRSLLAVWLALALLSAAPAAEPGPWDLPWGDQGDGTYRNPVLNADFADSDIEWDAASRTWFMITSTNHLAPAMTVLASRDLVNWRYAAHVWPGLSWKPDYDWRAMDGYRWGTWAGDLSHHDGRWFCHMIDKTYGLIVSTAPQPTGPWSEPVTVLQRMDWTDPAVYWDETAKQGYLLCHWGDTPGGPKGWHDLRLFKLSADGTKLLDDGVVVYSGPRSEAAKIHRIDGRWYIMAIDWVDGDRKQIALRSTTGSIYGPYERRVVLQRGNGFTHSACQGSLVQDAAGAWWFMHQLVQNGTPNFQGRPQALEPVQWIDGWPQIGADIDADGVGEPVWVHAKPAAAGEDARDIRLATSDEFDSPTLGLQWLWNHNPRDDRWSLTVRPGWLVLTAGKPVREGGFWRAANTLSQPILGTARGDAIVKLDLAAMRTGQVGGLCHFSDVCQLLGVRIAADGARTLFANHNGREAAGPALAHDTIWLRSSWQRDAATFAYSLDGATWQPFGEKFKLTAGNWRGDRVGLFTWNDATDDAAQAGALAADWFHLTFSAISPR